ncbi:MAG: PEGA domain-containing protein [Polyangiaceae bacterium]|nr:PEGA domain-containing protein [Polyangiaceae bacterium]
MVCALGAALAAGAPALAAGAPEDAAAAQRAHFERGNRLYDAKDWAGAEREYRLAWEMRKSYDLAANLADVELELGRTRDAAEYLAYALRAFPVGGKPAIRQELARRLADAKKRVGTVRVTVSRPGAEVLVDGKPIGYAPLEQEVFVDPGARVIEARLDGHEAARETIEAGKGTEHEVSLTLVQAKPVAGSAPGATAGGPPASGGAVGLPPAEAPATAERSVVPAIVLGGVAVVGLGVGIGLLAGAGGKADSAEELHASITAAGRRCAAGAAGFDARCPELADAARSADTLHDAGVGALIGAGVAAAAAGAYLLWWPAPEAAAGARLRVRAAPAVSATARGVVVVGAF